MVDSSPYQCDCRMGWPQIEQVAPSQLSTRRHIVVVPWFSSVCPYPAGRASPPSPVLRPRDPSSNGERAKRQDEEHKPCISPTMPTYPPQPCALTRNACPVGKLRQTTTRLTAPYSKTIGNPLVHYPPEGARPAPNCTIEMRVERGKGHLHLPLHFDLPSSSRQMHTPTSGADEMQPHRATRRCPSRLFLAQVRPAQGQEHFPMDGGTCAPSSSPKRPSRGGFAKRPASQGGVPMPLQSRSLRTGDAGSMQLPSPTASEKEAFSARWNVGESVVFLTGPVRTGS